MSAIVTGLTGLVTVMLLGLGSATMFAPTKMLDNFAVDPRGNAGLNTLRGVIGGIFLGCVTLLASGLYLGEPTHFLAVAILLGAIAFGRVVGLVVDGFEKAVIPPTILELVMVAILTTAYTQGMGG